MDNKSPVNSQFCSKGRERGAVLMILALVLFVIVGMIALAIDGSRLFSAHSDKLMTAESVALAALDSYLSQPPAYTHVQRLTAARQRVLDIGLVNGSGSAMLASQLPAGYCIDSILGGCAASSKVGDMTAGIWWTYKPSTCLLGETCPCYSDTTQIPCLQTCTASSNGCIDPTTNSTYLAANAIQVRLASNSSDQTTQVKSMFAGIFGGTKFLSISSGDSSAPNQATASFAPKNGVLLIDVSKFSEATNYEQYAGRNLVNPAAVSTPNGTRDYAVRIIPPDNTTVCSRATACLITGNGTGCASGYGVNMLYPKYMQTVWQDWINRATTDRSQYTCRAVTRNSGTVTEYYFINTVDNPPKPLDDILTGLNSVLTNFQGSMYLNDRLAVMFVDHELMTERSYAFMRKYDASVNTLKSALANRLNQFDSWIFPRVADSMPVFRNTAITTEPYWIAELDLPKAIDSAVTALTSDTTFLNSENFIAYIGPALPTCTRISGGGQQCANQWTSTKPYAWQEVGNDRISNSLVPNNIRFNMFPVVLTGTTLNTEVGADLVRSDEGSHKCQTEVEKRRKNYLSYPVQSTWPSTVLTLSDSQLLNMYGSIAVNSTGGFWFPAMPQCTGTHLDNTCDTVFTTACQGISSGAKSTPPSPLPNAMDTFTYGLSAGDSGSFYSPCTPNTVEAVTCDGFSRYISEQIADGMTTLLSQRNYVLAQR